MDLLESGVERAPRPLGPRLRRLRPPGWAVVAGVVLVGVLAVARVQDVPPAGRTEVDVLPDRVSATTVQGVARGELAVQLVNRGQDRVRLGRLRVLVEGLRVTGVRPAFGRPLTAYERRLYRVAFVVPDCSRLVLPGRVQVSLAADGRPLERHELAVVRPGGRSAAPGELVLSGCPPASRGRSSGPGPEVAVQPLGVSATRLGVGVRGELRLQVHNAGPPLRLVELRGEVPGVRFGPPQPADALLETDAQLAVRLPFQVEDCADLGPAGRLLLVVDRAGAQQELGLRAVAEPEAGVGPQVDLSALFGAC